ncbi:MAG TPA: acyl carrier protein [Acidimicrobiales bacterium]|nr:acyl carrier protein [Acidimicrobiales bacterium]HLN42160.1 acyl carrier protein [Acidimicrobiales bacterium]
MTDDDARDLIRTVLGEVAPEADLDSVGPDETMQEALDLDSIDFLNFVTGLHERTGLEIPERDYPELSTVEGCVRYLTTSGG